MKALGQNGVLLHASDPIKENGSVPSFHGEHRFADAVGHSASPQQWLQRRAHTQGPEGSRPTTSFKFWAMFGPEAGGTSGKKGVPTRLYRAPCLGIATLHTRVRAPGARGLIDFFEEY